MLLPPRESPGTSPVVHTIYTAKRRTQRLEGTVKSLGELYHGKVKKNFIESKTFEIMLDHGGGQLVVRIYEKGRDSFRSVHKGKTSTTCLVANKAELESKHSTGTFLRTIREGDIVFIIQRCSNNKG